MKPGLSVRWRLTVVYTLTAVLTSAALLAVVYLLVREGRQGPDGWVSVTAGDSSSGPLVVTGDPLPSGFPTPGAPVGPDFSSWGTYVETATAKAVDDTMNQLLWWSGAGLLLMGLVSVGTGWLFAGRMLAPVHTITSRAREISAESLDERVSLGGPRDELRELADTFDSLLDRLQGTVESERRLVATMSHELRTPLANQRVALDVALADPNASVESLRAAAETALGQAERANATIEALLTLARVQSGVEPSRDTTVDLADLVATACEEVRSGAAELTWRLDLEPAKVSGNPELLARAVVNLVANAAAHNVPEGWVEVTLRATDAGARLVVANSGPQIAPGTVDNLILPFRRGHHDRVGSHRGVGLGLSIVSEIVDHHGGRLELGALDAGGLRVELTLPA